MDITINVSDEDTLLVEKYAFQHGLTVSEYVRQAVMEKIEDEYDLKCYEKAMEVFLADPTTYTCDEIGRMLGLD